MRQELLAPDDLFRRGPSAFWYNFDMIESEEPNTPSKPEAVNPLDQLEQLTPEGAATLKTIQEIVMKKGVDIVDSPTAMQDLKERLGEPGYFFDVLNEYTPRELGEGDTIGRGFAYNGVFKAPDGSDIGISLKMLIPVGPRPDEKGRRILANCWLDISGDTEEVAAIIIRFYSITAKFGSTPLIEIHQDLNHSMVSDSERQMSVDGYLELRPKIEAILDNLGLLSMMDARFAKYQEQGLDSIDYIKLMLIKQGEIDLVKFNHAIKEMAESK